MVYKRKLLIGYEFNTKDRMLFSGLTADIVLTDCQVSLQPHLVKEQKTYSLGVR